MMKMEDGFVHNPHTLSQSSALTCAPSPHGMSDVYVLLKWKRNVQDINGEVLCVSQFTLLASTKKGSKPDFHGALGGDEAKRLYQYFFDKMQEGYGVEKVKNGVFQAMMEVALVNDGPVCTPLPLHPTPFPSLSEEKMIKV